MVKELIQGLGGFDGKASSVSAVDLLGLLGTENAKSTVQALIDVIADKVLNQLLSRSNVVNNALTTEEGYALDARMGKSLQDQITAQNSNLQHGSVDITLAVNKEEEHEVVFPYTFAKIPTVMVSIERNGYTSSATVMVRKGSVTTSGFKFTSINSESINAEVVVSWFAITK